MMIGLPSMVAMMSPGFMPALSAGPFGTTPATSTPSGSPVMSVIVASRLTPRKARCERVTLPVVTSCWAMSRAV